MRDEEALDLLVVGEVGAIETRRCSATVVLDLTTGIVDFAGEVDRLARHWRAEMQKLRGF